MQLYSSEMWRFASSHFIKKKKQWNYICFAEIVSDPENTHGQIIKLNNMLILYVNALSLQRTKPYKVLHELWKVYAIIIQILFNPRLTIETWEQAPLSANRKQWGCSPAIVLMWQHDLTQLRTLIWNQTSSIFNKNKSENILEMCGALHDSWLLDLLYYV